MRRTSLFISYYWKCPEPRLSIERGNLLEDLKELLEPDILHLVNLLLTDVQIQVKYENKIGETFKSDIGSPQCDCASQDRVRGLLGLGLVYFGGPLVP